MTTSNQVSLYIPPITEDRANTQKTVIDGMVYLSNFLKYVGYDIPELTYRLQQLANEVIDLESKKKKSIDELAQLGDTLDWYHRNIKINKQILSDLDKKIDQSSAKTSN